MNIQKYLLLQECSDPSNDTSVSYIQSNRTTNDLTEIDQVFDLKNINQYKSRIIKQYHSATSQNKNLIFLTYGMKKFVLPESLKGINELFQYQVLHKDKLFKNSIGSFFKDILSQQIRRKAEQEEIKVSVKFYGEQQKQQNTFEVNISTMDNINFGLSCIDNFKSNQKPFTNCITKIMTLNSAQNKIIRTICFVQICYCTKQLSLQNQIIINHTLDCLYKYLCKGDQASKTDCKVTNQVSSVLQFPSNIYFIGYSSILKGQSNELKKIISYLKKFRSIAQIQKQQVPVQRWKPTFSKQLKDSVEQQIDSTKKQVMDLKGCLRLLENDIMNIWCGELNVSKKLIFEPNIKKIINYEQISSDIAQIQALNLQYQKIQEQSEMLEQKLAILKAEPQSYDRRSRPVTQSSKSKLDFQQIKFLEAQIQQKQKQIMKYTQYTEAENTYELPLMSIATKTQHPKSAQVRRPENHKTISRPLTGIPSNSQQNTSKYGFSSRSKLTIPEQTLDQKTISKAYFNKFKLQRQSYIKSHESIIKNIIQSEDSKIQNRRINLKNAILEAKRIIEKENKMLLLKDENLRIKQNEQQMLRRQIQSNKLIRRKSRSQLKKSFG